MRNVQNLNPDLLQALEILKEIRIQNEIEEETAEEYEPDYDAQSKDDKIDFQK